MSQKTLTSFTVCDAYRMFAGQHSYRGRLRIEYLIPTNNIIVLDSHCNLMNIPNRIDRL